MAPLALPSARVVDGGRSSRRGLGRLRDFASSRRGGGEEAVRERNKAKKKARRKARRKKRRKQRRKKRAAARAAAEASEAAAAAAAAWGGALVLAQPTMAPQAWLAASEEEEEGVVEAGVPGSGAAKFLSAVLRPIPRGWFTGAMTNLAKVLFATAVVRRGGGSSNGAAFFGDMIRPTFVQCLGAVGADDVGLDVPPEVSSLRAMERRAWVVFVQSLLPLFAQEAPDVLVAIEGINTIFAACPHDLAMATICLSTYLAYARTQRTLCERRQGLLAFLPVTAEVWRVNRGNRIGSGVVYLWHDLFRQTGVAFVLQAVAAVVHTHRLNRRLGFHHVFELLNAALFDPPPDLLGLSRADDGGGGGGGGGVRLGTRRRVVAVTSPSGGAEAGGGGHDDDWGDETTRAVPQNWRDVFKLLVTVVAYDPSARLAQAYTEAMARLMPMVRKANAEADARAPGLSLPVVAMAADGDDGEDSGTTARAKWVSPVAGLFDALTFASRGARSMQQSMSLEATRGYFRLAVAFIRGGGDDARLSPNAFRNLHRLLMGALKLVERARFDSTSNTSVAAQVSHLYTARVVSSGGAGDQVFFFFFFFFLLSLNVSTLEMVFMARFFLNISHARTHARTQGIGSARGCAVGGRVPG